MEELRFIGALDGVEYEIDEWFVESLLPFSIKDRGTILHSVIPLLDHLPIDNHLTQIVGGVIKKETPIFFSVEYFSQEQEAVLLLDVQEITSDEYLDLILENNTLKYYDEHSTSKTIERDSEPSV
jgi:hypothetical protein